MMEDDEEEIASLVGKRCGLMRKTKKSPRPSVELINHECVICMHRDVNQIVTSCGHHFCSSCFEFWYKTCEIPRKCPVCRTHVSLEEIHMIGKSHEFNLKRNSTFTKYTKPVRIVEPGARNANLRRYGSTSFYLGNVDQITPVSLTIVCLILCFIFGIIFYRYK